VEQPSQFRVLFRDFLGRSIDLDVLAAGGDAQNLLVQFAALLGAFSLVVAIEILPRYGTSRLPRSTLLVNAWLDQEFLISTTMVIAGMFAVLAWNTLSPDRRDALVLGPLPVRAGTIFRAKMAAIGTALAVSIFAVNAFTGLGFPFVLADGFFSALRSAAAYWIAQAAAGVFVLAALMALQGLAAQAVGYRRFQRLSGLLQLAAFFAILGVYFLKPPLATPGGLAAAANQRWLALLPPYWFLGLFQELNGGARPVFAPLATRALEGLGIATVIAAATFLFDYRRNMARIVEQPDIAPADRNRSSSRLVLLLARRLLPRPVERAIVLFTVRTLARSRQHRLIFAAYGGIALAIALAYTKSLLYGESYERWDQPNVPLLAASMVLLVFAVVGARAVFALPISLGANWVFRITAVHRPAAYFAAVRKSLAAIGVLPVWIASAAVCFFLWPGRNALEHMAILGLVGATLVYRSLYRFRKIPFACSYLPGKSNLKIKLGTYGILFLFLCDQGMHLERWTMEKPARYAVLFTVAAAFAVWSRHRTLEFAASTGNRVQFEDLPVADVHPLDLHSDEASSGDDSWVDAMAPAAGWRQRLKAVGMGVLMLLAAGLVYEQFGEWRDRQRFPQVGRAYDVGGRKLNLYCSGQGSPTVVFDSGHGGSGVGWATEQQEVAGLTRACWFDRPGFGWSDPGPCPCTSDIVARDLHTLLGRAGVRPPYVLVGHSLGGFDVRVFTGFYPNEVAGLVLVDASHEDTLKAIPNMPHRSHPEFLRCPFANLVTWLGWFGVVRLVTDAGGGMGSRPISVAAEIREGPGWRDGEMARAAGSFGDKPLIVLTAGRPLDDEMQAAWIRLQAGLAKLSTRGRQVIVWEADHGIPEEAPDAVVGAVREVLGEVRSL
jgi:pimeloyl-ACP methyl ester carboxylesterase/drug/metabolite transporter superfamily protein YnfA